MVAFVPRTDESGSGRRAGRGEFQGCTLAPLQQGFSAFGVALVVWGFTSGFISDREPSRFKFSSLGKVKSRGGNRSPWCTGWVFVYSVSIRFGGGGGEEKNETL